MGVCGDDVYLKEIRECGRGGEEGEKEGRRVRRGGGGEREREAK